MGPAVKPMSLAEFLRWGHGSHTHYELNDGFPVAMTPPPAAHRMLRVRLGTQIEAVLSLRRPCNAQMSAGVMRRASYFEADVAATCEAHEFGQQALREPFLIIEILSPSTERHDRRVKLPVYCEIGTVQEIVLIAADDRFAEVYRRAGGQWLTEIVRGGEGVLRLASAPLETRLSELYEGIALDEPP
jgi:Uma2 family endonuclease